MTKNMGKSTLETDMKNCGMIELQGRHAAALKLEVDTASISRNSILLVMTLANLPILAGGLEEIQLDQTDDDKLPLLILLWPFLMTILFGLMLGSYVGYKLGYRAGTKACEQTPTETTVVPTAVTAAVRRQVPRSIYISGGNRGCCYRLETGCTGLNNSRGRPRSMRACEVCTSSFDLADF